MTSYLKLNKSQLSQWPTRPYLTWPTHRYYDTSHQYPPASFTPAVLASLNLITTTYWSFCPKYFTPKYTDGLFSHLWKVFPQLLKMGASCVISVLLFLACILSWHLLSKILHYLLIYIVYFLSVLPPQVKLKLYRVQIFVSLSHCHIYSA